MGKSQFDNWDEFCRKWERYLRQERAFSENTISAYLSDICQFRDHIRVEYGERVGPQEVTKEMIESYMAVLYDRHMEGSSQGRKLSGIRNFYRFLLLTDRIEVLPTDFVEYPGRASLLPAVLTVEEVERLLDAIDLSTALGIRNRAMLEMAYSCGLRVSELIALRFSDLFFDDGYVRIVGKGNKERLVPIGQEAVYRTGQYLELRREMHADVRSADIVFLNRRGKKLTRQMVFHVIREAAVSAGIEKTISPHILRHSFATHLLQGGANIRQVQELLGHESVVTTEIYTHISNNRLRSSLAEHHPLSKMNR